MPSLILAQNGGVNSTVSKKDTQNKEKIVTGKSSDYNKIRYKNGDVYELSLIHISEPTRP